MCSTTARRSSRLTPLNREACAAFTVRSAANVIELAVPLHVEEVRGAQMRVTVGDARVDAGGVDDDLQRGAAEVAIGGGHRTGPTAGLTTYLRDDEVTYGELNAGVAA